MPRDARGVCSYLSRFFAIVCFLALGGPDYHSSTAAPTWAPLVTRAASYTVPVLITERSGRVLVQAGTVFPPGSLVVTTATTIRNAERVVVETPSGRRIAAAPVAFDGVEDLTVLKVAEGRLPAVNLSDTGTVMRGDEVGTIGYPLATLRGIFDAMPAFGHALLSQGGPAQSFLIDAVVNTGYSGAPALDARGRLVGIVRAWVPSAQGEPWVIGVGVAQRLASAALRAAPRRPRPASREAEPTGPPSTSRVIKLALQVPLSGPAAFLGEAMREGSQLAMQEKAATVRSLGFEPRLVLMDDQNRPEVALANATAAARDPDVTIAIGHFATGVALAAAPAYTRAGLALLAPASSVAGLTDAGYANLFRLVGRDDLQGTVAARYLFSTLRLRRVYVIYEKDTHGLRTAAHFAWEAQRLGLQVEAFHEVTAGDRAAGLVADILSAPVDAIYFGGTYRTAAQILRPLRARGSGVTFVGDDGLDSSEFLFLGGDAVSGVIYATPSAPARLYPHGAAFGARFVAQFGHAPGPYAAQAYDAVAVALDAIERVLTMSRGIRPNRIAVLHAIRRTRYPGVTGTIEFDSRGDRRAVPYFLFGITATAPEQWVENRLLGTILP